MAKTILFEAISGSRVDVSSGVIRGVSVITEGEAVGHGVTVDSKTLLQVKASAESFNGGIRVKSNHGTGFDAIVGTLKNFSIDGKQLRADLHLLRSHSLFNQVLEIASTFPESFGLSVHFSGVTEENGKSQYARCDELYSVDLVDRPAANPSGLFSAKAVDYPKHDMAEKSFLEELKAFVGISKELSEPKISELSVKLVTTETELAASRKSVDELNAKVSDQGKVNAELSAKVLALDAKIAKHASELEAKASARALEITASQGVPSIKTIPDEKPAATKTENKLFGRAKVQAEIRKQLGLAN